MRRRMVLATNPDAARRWTCGLRHAHPYSVLLPAGLAVPPSLRSARWALTPPFQPCLCALRRHRRSILCGAIPRITSGGRYPPPYPRGARTFLPASIAAPLSKRAQWLSRNTGGAAVRPTGERNVDADPFREQAGSCSNGRQRAHPHAPRLNHRKMPCPVASGGYELRER